MEISKYSFFRFEFFNEIPLSRGLGSSSAVIVSAIASDYAIEGIKLEKDKLLNLAYADDTGARILSRKFAIAQQRLEATNDAERDAFLKRLGLKEREIENAIVCHATEEKKDMRSAFDFVQAVTAAARISSTVERRSELEEIAGNYFKKVTA